MKIQKIFIAIMLFFSANLIKAQHIGFTAGTNFSTITYNHSISNNNPLPGVNLGVVYERPMFNDDIYFQTGLIFSQKGSSFKRYYYSGGYAGIFGAKYDYYEDYDNIALQLAYIDIPLLIEYKYKIPKIAIIGKFGPSYSFGIFGKESIKYEDDNKIRFDGKDHREFDVGINFALGFEWNQTFQFTVNYQIGLTNIEIDAVQQRNKVMQFSIFYFLNNLYFYH